MGLRINTNLASIAAQSAFGRTTRATDRAMKQLATGNRFVDVSEGAADFAIGEKLRAQVSGEKAALNNVQTASSFIDTAEGGLNEQNNLLIRMRELTVQSASDTYSDDERKMMNYEFQQLSKEFDRIAQTTQYGSEKLLAGNTKTFEFQVGAYATKNNRIKYTNSVDTTGSGVSVDGLDVLDQEDSADNITKIDKALSMVGNARSSFAAIASRLSSIQNSTEDQMMAIESARSKIEDTDVADAYGKMVSGQALQQYQLSILSEANHNTGNLLKLIA